MPNGKRKSELPKGILRYSEVTSGLLLFLNDLGITSGIVDIEVYREFLYKHWSKKERAIVERAVNEGEMLCSTCGTEASWGGCDNPTCAETKIPKARK